MAAFIYRYKTSLKRDIGLISLVSCNAAVTKDRCCIIAIIIIIKTKNRPSNKQTSGPNGPVGNNLLFPQYWILNFSSVHMNKKLEMTWNSFNHNPNPHR